MRSLARSAFIAALCASFCCASPAAAHGGPGATDADAESPAGFPQPEPRLVGVDLSDPPSGAPARPKPLRFGVGIVGAAGLGHLDAPSPAQFHLPRSGDPVAYPSFSGAVLAGGVSVDLRFYEIVGLEVNLLYAAERLRGTARRGDRSVALTLSQPAYRIPILLKGILPLETLSPFLALGPELAFYGLSDFEAEPPGVLSGVAAAEHSLWWVLGAGVEWPLPISGLDLRLPLSVRASFNPRVPGDLDGRVTALPTDAVVFDSRARFQLLFTTGLTAHF